MRPRTALLVGWLACLALHSTARSSFAQDGAYRELAPPMRVDARGFYDPGRDRYLVIGGSSRNTGYNSNHWGGIWSLDPSFTKPWALVPESNPNPPFFNYATPVYYPWLDRYMSPLIYDPVRDRMLVPGGVLANGDTTSDVWAMSLGANPTWSLVATTAGGPAGRRHMFTIYDPVGDRLVYFGGVGPHPTFGIVEWNEVWTLSLSGTPTWQQLSPSGTPPPRMEGVDAVYDPARHRMIIHQAPNLWALSLDATPTWTQLPAASDPGLHSVQLIADSPRDRILLFGETYVGGVGGQAQLWTIPMTGGTFGRMQDVGVANAGGAALLYDSARSRLVDYGGFQLTGARWLDVTRSLDLTAFNLWDVLGPPVIGNDNRSRGFAVRDPSRPRVVVVGGSDLASRPESLGVPAIAYDLAGTGAWAPITETNRPLPYFPQPVAFDPRRHEVLAFTPDSYGGAPNHSRFHRFSLDTQAWTTTSATNNIPASMSAIAAIVDSANDRLALLGVDLDSTFQLPIDVAWALPLGAASPTWTRLLPPNAPTQNGITGGNPVAVYDPVRQRALYFGDGNVVLSLNLGASPAWTRLDNLPSYFYQPMAAYDPVGDRIVIFYADFNHIPNAWLYAWPLSQQPSAAVKLAPAGPEPPPGTAWFGAWIADQNRFLLLGGEWGFYDYLSPGASSATALAASCPVPATWVAGGSTLMQFQFTQDAIGVRSYRWRLDSARNWPGFPILGTQATSGPATVSLNAFIPVPDTAAAGSNDLLFTVYDLASPSLRDSCASAIHSPAVGGVAVVCPGPTTWLAGAVVPRAFGIVEAPPGGHTFAWRLESARAWSGFPVTGTQAVGGSGSATVNVGVPVPDTMVAGTSDFTFAVYDLADPTRRDSCLTTLYAPVGVGPGPTPLAFGARSTLVTHGALDVSFSVPAAGVARIDAYDLRGRHVATASLDAAQAGAYALRLADAGALRPGMYFLRLTQAGKSVTGRVIVLGAP